MAYMPKDRDEEVAFAISELRYAEMQEVAKAIFAMTEDYPDYLMSAQGIADLLAGWSERVINDFNDRIKENE